MQQLYLGLRLRLLCFCIQMRLTCYVGGKDGELDGLTLCDGLADADGL